MLRIDKSNKSFQSLEPKTLKDAGYWERRDLQKMIRQAPEEFCKEIDEEICFVGEEVEPTDIVQDRIDLLGIDPDGTAVIVEIKRDNHKLHLLQALSYAGMIAKWKPKQFVEALVKFGNGKVTFEQAKKDLEEVLEEGDLDTVNRNQRILLLAEEFDFTVLITAEWLSERFGVDIHCYRLSLALSGNDELLTCTRAYPPPALSDIAVRRRRSKEIGATEWADWTEALQGVENKAVADFFRAEKEKREGHAQHRRLFYRLGLDSKRRLKVQARTKSARVYQFGRFANDESFWRDRLSEPHRIAPKGHGHDLRFYLTTEEDFQRFNKAIAKDLANVSFSEPGNDEELGESEGPT